MTVFGIAPMSEEDWEATPIDAIPILWTMEIHGSGGSGQRVTILRGMAFLNDLPYMDPTEWEF